MPGPLEAEASSGRLTCPPIRRVRTGAGAGRTATALPKPWQILRPLAPDHPDQTTCGFSWAWPPAGVPGRAELTDEQRLALLDEAIAAFRSILIRRPELVRVRLELALAFYLKEEDGLAREHFERALVGKPPAALVANVTRFLKVMRARRRWDGYFGFSIAPDTNINAASDAEFIYINGLPFRRGAGPGQFRYRRRGLGRRRIPVSSGRALAPAHGVRMSTTGSTRGAGSTRRTPAGYVGPRWLIDRNTE